MPSCPICASALPAPSFAAPDRLHGTSTERFAVAICGTCGAGTTLPRVGADELAGFYPASYGPYAQPDGSVVAAISKAIRAWQGRRAWRSQPLASLHEVPTGRRGLDVGAGRGDLSAMLGGHGFAMTAVEPSPEAAAVIAARGIDARTGVVGTTELEDDAFAFAVFQQSLEHTPDPVDDLRTTHAALQPGGRVLVSVPNFGSWQARRFRSRWYHLDVPRHRIHFTQGALEHALHTAGFRVERFSTSTSGVGLPASIQYRAFGRCLFPGGLSLRIAAGLAAAFVPFAALLARVTGGGDMLHAVAVKSG